MDSQELEDRLSTPSPALLEDLGKLDGDLLVLGAGGKMGPSLARLAKRALGDRRVVAVSRWSDVKAAESLAAQGVEILQADLSDSSALAGVPRLPNVVFMVGRKFGTSGQPWQTWWTNAYVPAMVAERFRDSRIAVFSTGNVYPLVPLHSGGADPDTPVDPIGEYGQAALARERMFEYAAAAWGTPISLLRLTYAIDLRYGVLVDIGRTLLAGEPVDVSTGMVNVCWQGWANEVALRSLLRAATPPAIVNVAGPETISVRWLATRLAAALGVPARFTGQESDTALLNNATDAHGEYGYPQVTLTQLIDWTAGWFAAGGQLLDKPTHFAVRSGRF